MRCFCEVLFGEAVGLGVQLPGHDRGAAAPAGFNREMWPDYGEIYTELFHLPSD